MVKRDTLLCLYKSLKARHTELRRRLGEDIRDLSDSLTSKTGDAAEFAFESGSEELSSNLAELEARELSQVERALLRLRTGTYGTCERCLKKIPLARLNALPFTTTCVRCQSAMETHGAWSGRNNIADWDRIRQFEPLEDQREINLARLEIEISGNHP
jgi:DnaK suppressor protein